MKSAVLIIGAGRLGNALARRLSEAGYPVWKAGRASRLKQPRAGIVWFCVPDAEISSVATAYARFKWRGKYAFHSSGVLTSNALAPLQESGAAVASVHPLMTFVKGATPDLRGVTFAIEGDRRAVAAARRIAGNLGARAVEIAKKNKTAYHAFATLICPLLVSLLATSEKTAALAGISQAEACRRMMPILLQTVRNYERSGAAKAFSGPIVRGDADTIRAHLLALKSAPAARKAYVALAQAAVEFLPNQNREAINRLLKESSRP